MNAIIRVWSAIALAAALALLGSPSSAAISVIQQNSNAGTNVTSISVTLGSGVTAGDFVFVCANGQSGTSGTTIALSDASGDTYTDSGNGTFSDQTDLGSVSKCGAFYSTTTGETVFTATFTFSVSAPQFSEIVAVEVAGITSPVFDKVPAVKIAATGTATSSNATSTLTSANELVAGYIIMTNGASGAGEPAGWTIDLTMQDNALVYDVVSATTSVTATATQNSSGAYNAWAFTFKSNASVGGCPHTRTLLGVGC
jgi:hypothetical protein